MGSSLSEAFFCSIASFFTFLLITNRAQMFPQPPYSSDMLHGFYRNRFTVLCIDVCVTTGAISSTRIINKRQDGKKVMTLWWVMNKVTVSHSGSLHLLIWSNYRKHLNNAEEQHLVQWETSDGAQRKGRDWPLNLMPHDWGGSHLGVALPVTDVFRVCRNWEHSSAEKCFPDVPDRFSLEVDFKATSWPQRTRPLLIFMF